MAFRLLSLSVAVAAQPTFSGRFFSGSGPGDAVEWLQALDTARGQLSPNPLLQDISMLYLPQWNGFVEGPTWGAWWTQNSYGTTLAALPFLSEPQRSFIKNANSMWFKWIGNGTRVGLDDPHPAPDGCLCDAATPDGAYYKQGDGNVPIHDWALEETLSGVIMQAEQLLIDRDVASCNATFLSLFNRTLTLIESRRDSSRDLFFAGDASNLLAPSYGAWLLPNGTRVPAYMAGMSISYIAALDRVIELEMLVSAADPQSPWAAQAILHGAQRAATLRGLVQLLEPQGRYFVKWMDPNGTLHGVLGQEKHGYIEAVANHDAVALGVAERVRSGLDEEIMQSLLGDEVPVNPVTGGPGLRPYSLVITNAGGLDDMEYAAESSWLWNYGTWVNGGEWATCEARMILAYFTTGRLDFALDSWRALMGFASIFRMDSPLVAWGSAVYQPSDPINNVYDMYAVGAALLRGLWSPQYSSRELVITPHVPANVTTLNSSVPLIFGPFKLYLASFGNSSLGISCVTIGGDAWSQRSTTNFTVPFDALPHGPNAENHSVIVYFGGSACPPPAVASILSSSASAATTVAPDVGLQARPRRSSGGLPLHPLSRETAARALRPLAPQDALLWLDASTLALADGASVARWPDASGNNFDATQATSAMQPIFRHSAAHGLPAVDFDGTATYLANSEMALPSSSTIFAVFRDRGTQNTCCTGVFFSQGGCNGLGTKLASLNDDADASVLMIDWSGSPDSGINDIKGRQVVASVIYNASGAFSFADACLQSTSGVVGAAGKGYMVGSRGNEDGRFLNGSISELVVFARPLNVTEMHAMYAYLAAKWPSDEPALLCSGPLPNCTLPPALVASSARLGRFVDGMRSVGKFADSLYELAHALLALESVAAWQARCAGLQSGSIAPLASPASERAADESFVASASSLASGLATVLSSYASSANPREQVIYAIWLASAENSQ